MTAINQQLRRAVAPLVVAALATGVAMAVGVGGDFPLSDDWSYAYTTRELCAGHGMVFLPWTGASLVLQAWYGAILCKLFGFSFTVLRISTVVVAASGVLALFLLMRTAGIERRAATLGAAVFGLCPLYLNLSFTFMTDVPFTAAALWAAYAYAVGLRKGDLRWIVAGSVLAAASVLIRQHGVFVAGAAGLAALGPADDAVSERLRRAAAATLVPLVAFAAYQIWLFSVHGAPQGTENKLAEVAGLSAAGIVNCLFRALAYLGALLAPVAAAVATSTVRRRPRLLAAAAAGMTLAAAALYLREGALMPYLTNVVHDFGLGALSLRDTLFLDMAPPHHAGALLAVPLTLIAIGAAAVLVAAWVGSFTRSADTVVALINFSFLLLLLGTLLHARYYFDRYLLPVVPFAIAAALATARGTKPTPLAWLLAASLGWYGVAGTHDYMAWNRARNAALAELERRGIEAEQVDGGFEYNAWNLAARLGSWPSDSDVRPGGGRERKSWWWVVDDLYVVSFHELEGYRTWAEASYVEWLVPGRGRVLVLQRATSARDL